MPKTLTQFIADVRSALSDPESPADQRQAGTVMAAYLADPAFLQEISAQCDGPRTLLHEDSLRHFCVVTHRFEGAKTGEPHDHGATWSIYGQVSGVTHMVDYDVRQAPGPDADGLVTPRREYAMHPGDVHLYLLGDVHRPSRTATTQLLRLEGVNMVRMPRPKYRIAD